MTENKDIIGIVKELQDDAEKVLEGELPYDEWAEGVVQHFPSIAKALLTGMWALEEVKKNGRHKYWDSGLFADKALSSIYSLPTE